WRAFSSASASETVVPSVTRSSRLTAPAVNSSASCSEVLPLPRCPTRATLRIRSADVCMPGLLSVAGDPTIPGPAGDRKGSRRACQVCPASRPGPPLFARLGEVVVAVLAQARAQAQDGLRVQLRDARLGHAEHFADLAQRQVLVVVEGDHE